MDRSGGVSSHPLRNLGGYCTLAWTSIPIKLETYTLSGIHQRRLNKDVVSSDPVKTVLILVVVEPVIDEVVQDLPCLTWAEGQTTSASIGWGANGESERFNNRPKSRH